MHVHDELTVLLDEAREDFSLVEDGLHAFFGDYPGFVDDFQCVYVFLLFVFHLPYATETAFAHDTLETEHSSAV